eukprot:COSAG02_NODE_12084_length_1600_cov_1.514990_1_plen_532_part_11
MGRSASTADEDVAVPGPSCNVEHAPSPSAASASRSMSSQTTPQTHTVDSTTTGTVQPDETHCAEERRLMGVIADLEARLGPLQERMDAADGAAEFARDGALVADIEELLSDIASETAGLQPPSAVPLTLSSHPGMAVKLLEEIKFQGRGYLLAIGPTDEPDVASIIWPASQAQPVPGAPGAPVILASDNELGLHIAELEKKLGEGNAVAFGTWGNHSMKIQDDGSISPVDLPEMVLGFAPCPHHGQNDREMVVLVEQGSEHTLRFDQLNFTPSTVSAVGRNRLIATKQAVVDSASVLRLRAAEATLTSALNLYEPQLSQLPAKLPTECVTDFEAPVCSISSALKFYESASLGDSASFVKLTLANHPGMAVVMLERVDFRGYGHWLGIEPVESTPADRIVTVALPDKNGSVILAKNKSLGLHIAGGNQNTREGNALLFGTWDHPPFVFNTDGTISSRSEPSLVLGFAPCQHQEKQKNRELVVFVPKDSEQQLVFESLDPLLAALLSRSTSKALAPRVERCRPDLDTVLMMIKA